MSDHNKNNELPEVYALRQDGGNWQISRRDFLKAAGIGAAVLGAGMNSGFVRPAFAEENLAELCKNAPAHKEGNTILWLLTSADGKYLLSGDDNGLLKCWDFNNFSKVSTSDTMVSRIKSITAGFVDEKSCVLTSPESGIKMTVIPNLERSSDRKLYEGKLTGFTSFAIDSRKVIYGIIGNSIYRFPESKDFTEAEKLTSFEDSWKGLSVQLIDRERKLLITDSAGIRILDLADKSVKTILEDDLRTAALVPGESRILVGLDKEYALISLLDGSVIWHAAYNDSLNMANPELVSVAVTPDGSIGILKGTRLRNMIWLVSVADGSLIRYLNTEIENKKKDNLAPIAVAGDGSKFAIAANNSIIFLSLPDLEIIGCPVDLSQTKDNQKGIEVSGTDPVTGKTVTYTLPCGAAIPAGAVCTCNCVAGSVPSCSCVSHKSCSCNSHRSYGGGGHYWHPN